MEPMSPTGDQTVEVVDGISPTQLVAGGRTSVQHFRTESGTRISEHSSERISYVANETFTVLIDGDERALNPGESFVAPPNAPHAAEHRSGTPVGGIDAASPPREDPSWGPVSA
jgi:quercetin dioxygenase-like cupin family protein